jgi:hypothetical protein
MQRLSGFVRFTLFCVAATPLMAQTQIGGGTCSSSTLNGAYAFSLTGRQVSSSGNFTAVFQGNGTASFDGLSKVTITLTTGTVGAAGTPLNWSGTYSVQSNCVGVMNITSGGSATLNIALYDTGADFLVTGNDAVYGYSGTGNNQPSGCAASTLAGVYTFNGTGFGLSGGAVDGITDGAGLLQFDGQSKLTVNVTISASGKGPLPLTLTGSYAISSNCVGSANLTDSSANAYTMSFSVYTASALASTDLYATLAESARFLISGGAHAIYGQPTATTASAAFKGKPADLDPASAAFKPTPVANQSATSERGE